MKKEKIITVIELIAVMWGMVAICHLAAIMTESYFHESRMVRVWFNTANEWLPEFIITSILTPISIIGFLYLLWYKIIPNLST